MKKTLLLALMLAGFSSAAHAATLDILLGTTSSDQTYSFAPGTLHPNLDLTTLAQPSQLALSNAAIINPASSASGLYAQPNGTLFGNNYLAVFGSPVGGTATFTLASGQHEFGFTWGTVDTYNTLVLTDSRNVQYTITGSDVIARIGGLSGADSTQADVVFNDPLGTIVTAELFSSSNSFEVGNFSSLQSAVPLPASAGLFMVALAGLFMFALRRKQEQAI